MQLPHRPDHFATLYKTPGGQDLWQRLQNPEIVRIMSVASFLRRPAVEALSPYLHKEFGHDMQSKLMRQIVGHMVRQILENRGLQLDRNNVWIKRPGNMFYSGPAYSAPDDVVT